MMGTPNSRSAKNLLPKEYAKAKELEKNIVQEYRELMYEDSAAPKKKYCELCQSLPTYGVTFFLVKEKLPGKNRLIPRLLGVNKESVMRVDERTKAVLKDWPLEQVKWRRRGEKWPQKGKGQRGKKKEKQNGKDRRGEEERKKSGKERRTKEEKGPRKEEKEGQSGKEGQPWVQKCEDYWTGGIDLGSKKRTHW